MYIISFHDDRVSKFHRISRNFTTDRRLIMIMLRDTTICGRKTAFSTLSTNLSLKLVSLTSCEFPFPHRAPPSSNIAVNVNDLLPVGSLSRNSGCVPRVRAHALSTFHFCPKVADEQVKAIFLAYFLNFF